MTQSLAQLQAAMLGESDNLEAGLIDFEPKDLRVWATALKPHVEREAADLELIKDLKDALRDAIDELMELEPSMGYEDFERVEDLARARLKEK